MRNFFNRLPAWGWLAVALAMMIAGLWLAYFLVVNPPETPAGMVQTVPTFTATAAEPRQTSRRRPRRPRRMRLHLIRMPLKPMSRR